MQKLILCLFLHCDDVWFVVDRVCSSQYPSYVQYVCAQPQVLVSVSIVKCPVFTLVFLYTCVCRCFCLLSDTIFTAQLVGTKTQAQRHNNHCSLTSYHHSSPVLISVCVISMNAPNLFFRGTLLTKDFLLCFKIKRK